LLWDTAPDPADLVIGSPEIADVEVLVDISP
jgi:hypothetical protein